MGTGAATLTYNWKIPADLVERQTCILRIRYNVTSSDLIGGVEYPLASALQNGAASGMPELAANDSLAYLPFAEVPYSGANVSAGASLSGSILVVWDK